MSYFQPSFIQFFKELQEHNNTEWFQKNKARYQVHVKEPFEKFLGQLLHQVGSYIPQFVQPPKGVASCTFRINRDIRFSNDKSPYKNHTAAFITPDGKNTDKPGFYIQMGADEIVFGGGIYAPNPKRVEKIRQTLIDYPFIREAVLMDSDFHEFYGGEIHGEKSKVIPKQFKELLEEIPMLAYKQFLVMRKMPAETMLHKDFLNIAIQAYLGAFPLIDLLSISFRDE